ncbi:MAG: hypothetical protein KDE51_02535 [Anaerolineales bacterium]|nr:hypothetical protein [Anaerolineales bacterium]
MMRKLLLLNGLTLLLLSLTVPTTLISALPTADSFLYLPLITRPIELIVSTNLPLDSATYLGDNAADQTTAVDIALDGSILLAGTMPTHNPAGSPAVELLGGGAGVIVRLDELGQNVLSITRIGEQINDMEINTKGDVVICGDFGLAVLNPTAETLQWHASIGTVGRCAVGADGTVAALLNGTVYTYDHTGAALNNWTVSGSAQNDVALDGVNQLVIVTGYNQVSSNLQLPFIRAWSYQGGLTWVSYDFSSAPGLGADTRGERVAIGRDGYLYFAGTINGGTGVSVFSRDPKNIDSKLGSEQLIVTDKYTDPFNIGSVKMSWYGRFDPTTGDLMRGQSLLTRLTSNDKGNSIAINAITADEQGNLFITGEAFCCIDNRANRQIAATTVGNYAGGEAFFMAVSADMTERYIWTPFTAPGTSAGGSPATGVGVRQGTIAIGVTLNQNTANNRRLVTVNAIQDNIGGNSDAYLAVWNQ